MISNKKNICCPRIGGNKIKSVAIRQVKLTPIATLFVIQAII